MSTITIKSYESYIKFINDTTFKVLKLQNIKISQRLPLIMCKSIMTSNIDNTDYILCPVFRDETSPSVNAYKYIQIGFTGTLKIGETYFDAFTREMREELGLQKGYNNVRFNTIKDDKKERVEIVYLVDIINLIPITSPNTVVNNDKNLYRKIGGVIHGSLQNMLDYIDNNICFDVSNDGIIGVAAINVGFIKKYIDNVDSYYKKYTFFKQLIEDRVDFSTDLSINDMVNDIVNDIIKTI